MGFILWIAGVLTALVCMIILVVRMIKKDYCSDLVIVTMWIGVAVMWIGKFIIDWRS